MFTKAIKTINDVKEYIQFLKGKDQLYHFDDDCVDIINTLGQRVFNDEEAALYDSQTKIAYDLCIENDIDIFTLLLNANQN